MGLQIQGAGSPDLTNLEQRVQAAHDLAEQGVETGQNARQMVLNRDAVLTSLQDVAGKFALEIARTDLIHDNLQRGIDALKNLNVIVGLGVANLPASIAGGALISVTVTLSKPMGSATYAVGYGLSGGASLLGSLLVVGVTGQTATTVTLQIRNTGLLALVASAAAVSVVAAREG